MRYINKNNLDKEDLFKRTFDKYQFLVFAHLIVQKDIKFLTKKSILQKCICILKK